jgi:cytochrome b561
MLSTKIVTVGMAVSTAIGITATKVPKSLVASNEIVMYLFSVGLSTLLLSLIGALLASMIAEPLRPKTKMWAIFIASAMAGAMASSFLPTVPGFGWVKQIPSQVLGFLVSLFGRWVIPAIIDVIPDTIRTVFSKFQDLVGGKKDV